MRVLLRCAYDGTDFSGCPPLDGERTVVGTLIQALARIEQRPSLAETLSRTDAGVHALDNIAHLVLPRAMPLHALLRALDRHLPADLRCHAACRIEAPPGPGLKTYGYTLDQSPWGDPLGARYAWRVPGAVDVDSLRQCADMLVGSHDFEAFRRAGETRVDLVRTLDEAAWSRQGDRLVFTVRGSGFPYRLVRSLVGAMVAVARGAHPASELALALRDPSASCSGVARHTAPAHGLCLTALDLDPSPTWGAQPNWGAQSN